MNNARGWWVVLTVAMCLALVWIDGELLRSPNTLLLAGNGDGLKNYYTFAWHATHDTGPLHFSGSGYPYGDHAFYTDCHPILTWLFQLFPALAPWKIGVLNVLLLMGTLLCAWCIFGILLHFKLRPWAAAACALGIALQEPQVYRLTGHLALAHSWVLPLIWYTWLRAKRRSGWYGSIPCGAAVLFAFLLHPYLGLMGAMFLAGHQVLSWLLERPFDRMAGARDILIAVVLPLAGFLVLERLSDHVTDRPSEQWGQAQYAVGWQSLLLPRQPPLGPFFAPLAQQGDVDWESWCYVGAASICVLMLALFKRMHRPLARPISTETILYFWSAIGVLLFAMDLWQQLLGAHFSALLQFRAMGRFAWVFYFVCAVHCAVFFYRLLLERATASGLRVAVFLLFPLVFVLEGVSQRYTVVSDLRVESSPFSERDPPPHLVPAIEQLRRSQAKAIIPLPFTHVGSDVYQRDAPDGTMALMYSLSYQSAIPLMAGNMIRTSARLTRHLLGIFAPEEFYKPLAYEFEENTSFILMKGPGTLAPDEQRIWALAEPYHADTLVELRTISARTLFRYERRKRIQEFAERSAERVDVGPPASGWTRLPGPGTIIALDTLPIVGTSTEYTTVLRVGAQVLDPNRSYELSFLFESKDRLAVNTSIMMESVGSDGRNRWLAARNLRSMPMQCSSMTIATLRFETSDGTDSLHFFLKGPDGSTARFIVRNVVLRPADVDLWRTDRWFGKQTLFRNNVPLAENCPDGQRGSRRSSEPHGIDAQGVEFDGRSLQVP